MLGVVCKKHQKVPLFALKVAINYRLSRKLGPFSSLIGMRPMEFIDQIVQLGLETHGQKKPAAVVPPAEEKQVVVAA